jgi:diguanylate cyclase (GGDEF)-like protein
MSDNENPDLTPGDSAPVPPPEPPLEGIAQPEVDGAAPAEQDGASAQPKPEQDGTTGRTKRVPPRRNLVWAAVGAVCLAAGVTGSILGSHSLARSDAANKRSSFQSAQTGIASTLRLAIAHEEDVLNSASTFFAAHPTATPKDLAPWAGWARVLRRHPEVQRLTLVGIVKRTQLSTFADHQAGRPAKPPVQTRAGVVTKTPVATKPPFPITPSGNRGGRAFYCLAFAELVRGPARAHPQGLDYCASRHELLSARDSGATAYASASLGGTPALAVTMPVYSSGITPGTTGARIATVLGWTREIMEPGVLVGQALRGRPGEALLLGHRGGGSNTVYASGTPTAGGQSATVSLRNGWSAHVYGPVPTTTVLGDRNSRWLLIGGCVLSLLLGVLIFLLGTRRARVPLPGRSKQPAQALYDELTGLPTRVLTMDRAERMLARAGRQSGMLTGALLIDIDWFKDVNEKLGHEAGDQLLKTVAERLETVVRDQDTVGRLEGDEFVIVVEAAARGARLDALARRVIEALHKPVDLEGFGPSFFLTASIGLAFGRYTSTEDLLRDARLALDSAKAAGKDRYTLFNANMRAVIEDRGVLEAELNMALREGQFFLLYQPIYDLVAHKVVAFEALIRWRHPKRGILLPGDFIPLAEETGLTVPIGRWVLEEACARAASWNVAGHHVGVSVMVTANQLNREGFLTDLLRALQQSGVEPSLLTLELAEATVIADAVATAEHLEQIKRLGVSIAVDDFGSGYAYRSDLQKMPLDYLKVDRRSLAASEDEDYRSWLLEAILVFARDLSLTVVAKGVETSEQLTNLRSMGCTMAQGYFMGDPVPAESVAGLLESHLPAAGAGSTT